MRAVRDRQAEVVRAAARAALERSLQESGFWFHDDIRDNFYAASYLYAHAERLGPASNVKAAEAIRLAESVMTNVLSLQNRDAQSAAFGHFPLRLGEDPRFAEPNPLPAELMGCLMACFRNRYEPLLSHPLREWLDRAIETLYKAGYYRVPLRDFNHHEAKHTATKLIFGWAFGDRALLADGAACLRRLNLRIREQGMAEYGALPWFWHWMQAFASAYYCVPEAAIRRELSGLLDALWIYRAGRYLKGAWIGGRMRSLGHDLPKDGNVAFDYVQFGGFPLPDRLPRIEYAGLLHYPAPEEALRLALDDEEPLETETTIVPADGRAGVPLRDYVYRTARYAVGGIRERAKEFDNEQHRWDVAFPLDAGGSVNHLYFFPPGEGYREGDPRHACDAGEVLFRRNVVAALYPADGTASASGLVGVLPKGDWLAMPEGLFGLVRGCYAAVYVLGGYAVREEEDRMTAFGGGFPAGVVVEVIDSAEAPDACVAAFADRMRRKRPTWTVGQDGYLAVTYETGDGERLRLAIDAAGRVTRTVEIAEQKERMRRCT